MPPVIIKVRDHRTFGRKPVVGRHVITAILFEDAPKIDAHAEIQGDFNTSAVVIPILFFFSTIMITGKVKINLKDIQQSPDHNILYNRGEIEMLK